MPKCKNSSTGTYKGTEPSPKGLGYCARGEKLGKKKKGLDGNIWEVKKTKNGIERWVKITKTKNSSNKTEKKTPKTSQKQTRGKKLKTNDIVVYKNRKSFKNGNNLSLSNDKNNNNLTYLMFGRSEEKKQYQGRLYFRLNLLKGNKSETIKDLTLNKKKQTFEFRYVGNWEDDIFADSKIIKVNDKWKIVFNNSSDFDKMEKMVKPFDVVKIIE